MPPKQQRHGVHALSEQEGAGRIGSVSVGETSRSGGGGCRVVLQPFMRDESSRRRYRFTALPAAAALYDKPDWSDVTLKLMPTDKLFHAHRSVLAASSDVFAAMLCPGSWAESTQSQLELHEELDCARVFDRLVNNVGMYSALYNNHFMSIIQVNLVGRHLQLRIGAFCWCKVLLSTCPC